MKPTDIKTFKRQFWRFFGTLSLLVSDVVRFNKELVIWSSLLSFIGTSLQAVALGILIYVIGRSPEASSVNNSTMMIFDMFEIPGISVLIIVGLALFMSVFIIYESERAVIKLSVDYANDRAALLLYKFRFSANRSYIKAVNHRTGFPLFLKKELKKSSRSLELACRSIFKSPSAILQFIYGGLFLLYLEPLLSGLLLVLVLILLLPLRKFAYDVNRAEQDRKEYAKSHAGKLDDSIFRWNRYPIYPSPAVDSFREFYSESPYSKSNDFIYQRRIGLARTTAAANFGLFLTVGFALAYFYYIYENQLLNFGFILLYLMALKLSVNGAKQIVRILTLFARFYKPVFDYFEITPSYSNGINNHEGLLCVRGENLSNSKVETRMLNKGGVFSIVGDYPLSWFNLHLFSFIKIKTSSGRKPLDLNQINVVFGAPKFKGSNTLKEVLSINEAYGGVSLDVQWRMIAPYMSTTYDFKELLNLSLDDLDRRIMHDIDRLNFALLIASRKKTLVLIISFESIRILPEDLKNIWLRFLSDKVCFVFYSSFDDVVLSDRGNWIALIDVTGHFCGILDSDCDHPEKVVSEKFDVARKKVKPRGQSFNDDEDDDD